MGEPQHPARGYNLQIQFKLIRIKQLYNRHLANPMP